MVSILIAARNEEHTILNCLQAIDNLSYPVEDLEILIGNDASEDRTEERINQYIRGRSHFKLINITHSVGYAKGKANVLAQLASQARGEYLFITDADIEVARHWVETMLQACQPETGIVSGTTAVKGSRMFDILQSLDWLYAQGLMYLSAQVNIPVSALGNNMMVSRKAYLATGGYENLPFSVTEDYALFREVVQRKFGFEQVVQEKALAYTEPAGDSREWLQQRKRWMKGAFQLPFYLVLPLLVQALFFPLLLILFFYFPWLAAGFLLVKTIFQAGILLWIINRLNQPRLLPYVWVFEPYFMVVSFASLLYYVWPGKIIWKGRKY
ncbi:glycosyltransferase [Rhodocytophaga rosea]|uniref:Glycosyltransferase n=1 Tax=Rhodocytophaga rosea TaxID=2704465 RepID=A0A6C0GUY0_9BACT|nr:glycosyltransferase [Rhodocytophaga rosea]QHT71142.1 glycosyltransferase [Rhodocytophaga rosea]